MKSKREEKEIKVIIVKMAHNKSLTYPRIILGRPYLCSLSGP